MTKTIQESYGNRSEPPQSGCWRPSLCYNSATMPSSNQGSVRLFRFSGIDVFLHWSWFVVAVYEIQQRAGRYSSIKWNIIEYLGLFLIVLLHEFGHALACRQVGGTASRIVLWPLGGVATSILRRVPEQCFGASPPVLW